MMLLLFMLYDEWIDDDVWDLIVGSDPMCVMSASYRGLIDCSVVVDVVNGHGEPIINIKGIKLVG